MQPLRLADEYYQNAIAWETKRARTESRNLAKESRVPHARPDRWDSRYKPVRRDPSFRQSSHSGKNVFMIKRNPRSNPLCDRVALTLAAKFWFRTKKPLHRRNPGGIGAVH